MSFPPEHRETVCLLINLLKLHCCPLKFSATFLPADVLFRPVPSFPGWNRAGGEGRVARRQRPQPAEYSGHHHCESFLSSVHLSRLDASFFVSDDDQMTSGCSTAVRHHRATEPRVSSGGGGGGGCHVCQSFCPVCGCENECSSAFPGLSVSIQDCAGSSCHPLHHPAFTCVGV